MAEQDIDHLKYPTGRFTAPEEITLEHVQEWIDTIETFPERLTKALDGVTEEQLEKSYRPGAWTVRQLVHHLADSHVHSYIRFKWAMSEDNPTIKGYDENVWSAMLDAREAPIDVSLAMITGVHARWVAFIRTLSLEDLSRTFFHPQYNRTVPLDRNLALYAWHGEHHLGHIEIVLSTKD